MWGSDSNPNKHLREYITLSECAEECRQNSLCVAFAYGGKRRICQFMGHCLMKDEPGEPGYRYFTKDVVG